MGKGVFAFVFECHTVLLWFLFDSELEQQSQPLNIHDEQNVTK